MGTIDKTIHHLTCPLCGASETANVLDKGSNWGGPNWQSSAKFERFDTTWSGGGPVEPDLLSATCKECSVAAQHTFS